MSTTLSAAAAQWVTEVSLPTVPEAVLEHTRLQILDMIGVMIASSGLEVVAAARRAVADSDGATGPALSLTDAAPTTPANAAFLNGVMSAVLEFDDTHIQSNIHPTGVVLSALLPECERLGLSGRNLLQAVLVGSELLCRLGLISPIRMHEVGFHPSSAYGIFGAVWGLAHLRRLTVEHVDQDAACGHGGLGGNPRGCPGWPGYFRSASGFRGQIRMVQEPFPVGSPLQLLCPDR
jgi:2-methylcitrate dehydratase PrpD